MDLTQLSTRKEVPKPPKPIEIPERDVQRVVLQYLERHPKVVWVKRMNVGMTRGLKFGFIGCSDLLGQLKDGRILAIEVKRKGQGPNLAQQNFIANVLRGNGVAGIVRSLEDIVSLFQQFRL